MGFNFGDLLTVAEGAIERDRFHTDADLKIRGELLVADKNAYIQRKNILSDAIAISNSGAFALVIECVVEKLAKEITNLISIPTIGIGASKYCDGQILVTEDMVGLSDFFPKFVRQYAKLNKSIEKCVKKYVKDVKMKRFPFTKNVYK